MGGKQVKRMYHMIHKKISNQLINQSKTSVSSNNLIYVCHVLCVVTTLVFRLHHPVEFPPQRVHNRLGDVIEDTG